MANTRRGRQPNCLCGRSVCYQILIQDDDDDDHSDDVDDNDQTDEDDHDE